MGPIIDNVDTGDFLWVSLILWIIIPIFIIELFRIVGIMRH